MKRASPILNQNRLAVNMALILLLGIVYSAIGFSFHPISAARGIRTKAFLGEYDEE